MKNNRNTYILFSLNSDQAGTSLYLGVKLSLLILDGN